jgi:hypothetical protein
MGQPGATVQCEADVCNCCVDVVCLENGVEGRDGADAERQEESAGVGLQGVSGERGPEELYSCEGRGVYETDAPESLRSAVPPSLATQHL